MNKKRVIKYGFGIALGAAGLYVFFRDVDTLRLWEAIKKFNAATISTGVALAILTIWLRSLRWRIILPDWPNANKHELFQNTAIGFMANNIFPARMGEAARALLLWKKNGYSPAVSFGSIIIERIIDVIVYMAFFFIPVFLIPSLKAKFYMLAIAVAAVVIFVITLGIIYAWKPSKVRKSGYYLLQIFPSFWQKKMKFIAVEIISNLDWLFSAKKVAALIVLSLGVSLCYVYIIVVLSASIQPLGLIKSLFCESLATFGAAIPLTPGYIGTLHATLSYGMQICGLSKDKAAALALMFHAIGYIPTTILGLYYFFRLNISYKEISSAQQSLECAKAIE